MHVPNKRQRRKRNTVEEYKKANISTFLYEREITLNSSRFLPVWPIRIRIRADDYDKENIFSLPVAVLLVWLWKKELRNTHSQEIYSVPSERYVF